MTDHALLCDIRDELRAILLVQREIRDALFEQEAARIPKIMLEPRAVPIVPYEQVAGMMDKPSLTSLQGPLRADDPRSSVDMRYPRYEGPTMGAAITVDASAQAWMNSPVMGAAITVDTPAQPDLDTALTMGMEAPAPLVPPDRKGPPSLYPRADLTPGVVFPNITAEDVSVPGYAKRVRAVPDAMKRAVYLRYGLDPAKHETAEVDHFCSLCLAGTNDIENLWPEPAVTPDAPGQIGFHQKDQTEMFLYHEVCHGTISLQAAQDTIRSDWYAVFLSIPANHPAMMLSYADAPEQP